MLTRRGWALVGVAAGALLMAGWFSARALNAIAGPTLVAILAGYLQLKRTKQPELRTETPDYGFAGETETVTLGFAAPSPFAGTVKLGVQDGLAVPDPEVETTVAEGELDFDVELTDRGVRSVGPVDVHATDVLGVWETSFRYPVRRDVVVFPKIHQLRDAADLVALHRNLGVGGREEFDQLREYERGDPLRDVHWKTSAKRADDDLVVMEFEANEQRQQVELLAEADGGRVDDVAEAAASVATSLLDEGLAVGLTVPGERLEPGTGPEHRTALLTLLARTSAGTVSDAVRERADVSVTATAADDAVYVDFGERSVTFDALAGDDIWGSDGDLGVADAAASGRGSAAAGRRGRTASADGGAASRDRGRTASADGGGDRR